MNERVALTLLALNQKFNEPGKKSKGVYFSRKDVANCSGTIIETLSRQLKILSKEKIVKVDGRNIFILDKERLFKIANI